MHVLDAQATGGGTITINCGNAPHTIVPGRLSRPRSSTAEREAAHLPRSDDLSLDELLVVALDGLGFVQVVDHDAQRFPQALPRRVGHPVDPLQLRAVVQVESRHRIERRLAAGDRLRQIGRAQLRQRDLQPRQALARARRVAGDLGEVGAELRGHGLERRHQRR